MLNGEHDLEKPSIWTINLMVVFYYGFYSFLVLQASTTNILEHEDEELSILLS